MRQNIKTSFLNGCSGIFFVESIEGWSKKQDKTLKQTSDHQTNLSGRSKQKHTWVTGKYIPQGEHEVICLQNPTEDKRAFWRMLTSADPIIQARIWKSFPVQNSTSLLYLPIPSLAETWKIVTKKVSIFFRLSWHFKTEKSVFWKASFCKTRTDYAYKTLWTRLCDW